MNSEYILPAGVDPQPFINKFSQELNGNLSDKIIKNLSGILALDYAGRLKKETEIAEHVNKCLDRLAEYLGHKVITDESFATGMTLFTVAISDKKKEQLDKTGEQLTEDIALDSFIEMHFGDIPAAERTAIKSLLKQMGGGKDINEIINFIHSNPKLFYSIVISATREKKKQQEIAEVVQMHLHRLIAESREIEKKNNRIVNIGSELSLVAGLTALVTSGVSLGSQLLATIALPATATAIKYSPQIGEEVGKVVARNTPGIQKHNAVLEEVKDDIIALSDKSQSISNILSKSQGVSLEAIKEKLQQQIVSTSSENLSHSQKVQKEKLVASSKNAGKGIF